MSHTLRPKPLTARDRRAIERIIDRYVTLTPAGQWYYLRHLMAQQPRMAPGTIEPPPTQYADPIYDQLRGTNCDGRIEA